MKRVWMLFLVGIAGWWMLRAPEAADDPSLFSNRLWVDRMPKDERDMVLRLMPLDFDGEKVGALTVGSQWRIMIEIFMWKLDGNRFEAEFPQDRKKLKATWRTWKCKGEAPEPFELCLELTVARKKLRLFSREDWVIESDTTVIEGVPVPRPQQVSACPDCVDGLPPALEAATF